MIRSALFTIVAACAVAPVSAQEVPCLPTDAMHVGLSEDYGEVMVFTGHWQSGMFEFWVNPMGGGWSVVVSKNGTSCLIATGKDWTVYPMEPNL